MSLICFVRRVAFCRIRMVVDVFGIWFGWCVVDARH